MVKVDCCCCSPSIYTTASVPNDQAAPKERAGLRCCDRGCAGAGVGAAMEEEARKAGLDGGVVKEKKVDTNGQTAGRYDVGRKGRERTQASDAPGGIGNVQGNRWMGGWMGG